MSCLRSTGLSTDYISILTPEREDSVVTFVKNLWYILSFIPEKVSEIS